MRRIHAIEPDGAARFRARFGRFQWVAAPFPSQSDYTLLTCVLGTVHAAQPRPCLPRGRPSLAAIVSATSARLKRAPIGPAGAPAPKARIGTCSRVWSKPLNVGSLP